MNAHMVVYMDGSALARRGAAGPEAEIVDALVESASRLVSSELAGPDAFERLEVVKTEPRIAAAAAELADRHRLDSEESVHLAVATSIDAPRVVFATWNPALAAAAAEHGLAVVPAG